MHSMPNFCKNNIRNEHHMETKHGIEIIPYKEIWKAIKDNSDYEAKKQKGECESMHVKRKVFLKWWKQKLRFIQEKTAKSFKNLHIRI